MNLKRTLYAVLIGAMATGCDPPAEITEVSGRVTGVDGLPIPGAEVTIYQVAYDPGESPSGLASTDVDGRFQVSFSVDCGLVVCGASTGDLVVDADGYERVVLYVPSGRSDIGDLTLRPYREPPATEEPADPTALASELVGRWRLSGYTLDDGTSKTVPDEVDVGASFSPDGLLAVRHDECKDYEISYRLDNGVLTTMDPVEDLGDECAAEYPDPDSNERSNLLGLALLNTQTMVAVSADDVLTVTTGNNEVLLFERFDEAASEPTSGADPDVDLLGRPWQLSQYTAPDGTLQDVLPEAVFQFRLEPDSSRAEAFDVCVDQNGSYELGDGFVVVRLDGPTDAIACLPDDPEAERQVDEARTILDGDRDESGTIGVPLTYAVEGNTLTLSAVDRRQLVFVEADELEQQP